MRDEGLNPGELRKRQIARQLGVSVRVLEQYLQVKRAEVLGNEGTVATPKILQVSHRAAVGRAQLRRGSST